jgi:hypothetical protein
VDDTTIQMWHQNHLVKTVARVRKGPVRKIRADRLRVNNPAEPKMEPIKPTYTVRRLR